MPGAGLTETPFRKALSDMLALKPYWGKPTVRDFRGGNGDVGIIRSPVRAIALLDHFSFFISDAHEARVKKKRITRGICSKQLPGSVPPRFGEACFADSNLTGGVSTSVLFLRMRTAILSHARFLLFSNLLQTLAYFVVEWHGLGGLGLP